MSTQPTIANMSYIADLARTRVFARSDGTVSDEILELLEIHVPSMIKEINGLRDQVDDFHAGEVVRESELRRLRKLEKLVQSLGIKLEFQFVSFDGEEGPITAEFQPQDFDKLEKISRIISQVREHLT